ncbi:MAG: metallophosphoesterase [Bradyrhizobium sp.]|jgi:3',5'-cyclic AMP phosphodiesterase CpdA|uniref:Metallophosphoesterase n=4 Tax=Bradyrhizobium TaxID=374 RepID=A0ABS5G347_9BRAD|nr:MULTISPECIES: metallophosphoesterase [Bradyrhizobium]MBR1135727.1 metallophosphoesterase [Bradyrhizobium denitrificans]MDU1494270.1 metallophosphoesterase [Bradyrhizobium sp.]MDU1544428.1 metallophosphoesterase [Bradyrhizobium sp.]MDU1690445.1 metallophosphoesterase [Bradyrhizobium sp.]MDU1808104.1 metallophosphoesterase [Bradyrhizobium sp.]
MAAFTLAHLSDPHLAPLPRPRLAELAGKRALGYLNWTRNRYKYHRRDILDLLVSDLHTQMPDQIAVTGDLVNFALESEFPLAQAWLKTVGPPDKVTAIPGNHDAYVRSTRLRFAESFAAYFGGDAPQEGPATFPSLRRRGPLALISLSSAVPSGPFMATGRLGSAQLAALEQLLQSIAHEQLFRVLLVHHPLRSANRMKRLTDAKDLIALLARHGVELILHGHDHVHSTIWIDGPERKIPTVGVPSASSIAHGHYPAAAYNIFAISRAGNHWRCDMTVRSVNDALRVREIRQVRLL